MYKQIIIARKDLNMSPGKLAAQVSHGSMAFLTNLIRNSSYTSRITNGMLAEFDETPQPDWSETAGYEFTYMFEPGLYEQWLDGAFTKCVLQAKNRNQLLKAKEIAESIGLKEGEDFWLVRDNCRTELEPEDEDGRTLTVIGFRPMDNELADKIGKKFHLYM